MGGIGVGKNRNIIHLLGTIPGTRLLANLIGIDTYNISSCTCFTYFHMQRTLTGFSIYYMSMPRRLDKSDDGWLNWGQITITKRKKCIFCLFLSLRRTVSQTFRLSQIGPIPEIFAKSFWELGGFENLSFFWVGHYVSYYAYI